jgi:hypothetical protein
MHGSPIATFHGVTNQLTLTRRMETAEMSFLREAARYKMTSHKRNEDIREELGVTEISEMI